MSFPILPPRSLTLLIPLPLTALSPQIPSSLLPAPLSLMPAPLPSSPASASPLLPFACAAFFLSPASPVPPSPTRGKVGFFTKVEEEREDSLVLLDDGDDFLLLDDDGDERRCSSSPSTCKEEGLPHVRPEICWSKEQCVKKPLQRQQQGRWSEADVGVVDGVVEAGQRWVLVQAAVAPSCAPPSSSGASTVDCGEVCVCRRACLIRGGNITIKWDVMHCLKLRPIQYSQFEAKTNFLGIFTGCGARRGEPAWRDAGVLRVAGRTRPGRVEENLPGVLL